MLELFQQSFPTWLITPLSGVLALLLITIILFIRNKMRMDIIALLVILTFSLTGLLNIQEVLAGFSDPNVILIALLFIIGEGIVRTGIANQVSEWLMKVANNNETKVLILLMLAVTGLGAFMSSTGVVAIFIPVTLSICRQMNISPRKMMMPLSVAALISGMMTLIATPPNLIAHSELRHIQHEGFGFFDFTPIGLGVLVMGVGYMLFARYWLDGKQTPVATNDKYRATMNSLIQEYGIKDQAKRFFIQENSPFIGKTLPELSLDSQYGMDIIAIERWRHFRKVMLYASTLSELREKDTLFINLHRNDIDIEAFCHQYHLTPMTIHGEYFTDKVKSIGMAEISPTPETNSLGQTLQDLHFRSRYNLTVVGIKSGETFLQQNIQQHEFKVGDTLLVIGSWRSIQQLALRTRDFFLLNAPVESESAVPALNQAPHAIISILIMVGLMVSDLIPNVLAALIGCLLMAKFRCIDGKSAYQSIHWPTLILIIGMMPFSTALQKTGGIALIVSFMLDIVGNLGTHGIMMSLFILCAVVGCFISNTATAILMMPIAIHLAQYLQASPAPFAMIVAVASSSAFITPVSSPVNTMVLKPAGYTFFDFVKIGLPFTILVMFFSVFLIPILFPLF